VKRPLIAYIADIQGRREARLRQGASLKGPSRLFNAGLEGNMRRAIDIHEGETLDAAAFKKLVAAAAALNGANRK
jgi:hypothetical protein